MVIKMKKIFSIFLTSLMIVSLAACGNSSQSAGTNSTNETGTEADTETKVQTNAQDSAEASASEDSAGTAASQEEPAASGKTLVVYYSASGNTGRVAELVADELGADTFEIIPAEVYSDEDLDWTNRDSRVCKEHDDTHDHKQDRDESGGQVAVLDRCVVHRSHLLYKTRKMLCHPAKHN